MPMPKGITRLFGRILGKFLGDVIITRDEIAGLSRGILSVMPGKALACPTRLLEWLDRHAGALGRKYANEVRRRR